MCNLANVLPCLRQLHADQHENRTIHEVRHVGPNGQPIEPILRLNGVHTVIRQVERGNHHRHHAGALHPLGNLDGFREQESDKRNRHHVDHKIHGIGDAGPQSVCHPTHCQSHRNAAEERERQHATRVRHRQIRAARNLDGQGKHHQRGPVVDERFRLKHRDGTLGQFPVERGHGRSIRRGQRRTNNQRGTPVDIEEVGEHPSHGECRHNDQHGTGGNDRAEAFPYLPQRGVARLPKQHDRQEYFQNHI